MNRRIPGVLALIFGMVVAAGAASSPPLQEIERQFNAGRYADAMRALESAISQSPRDARLHFWMARNAYEAMQFDLAVSAAERACQLEPANSEFHLWLARSLGRKAERDSSFFEARRFRHELEEAVRLAPSSIHARRDLAEFYASSPWIVGGSKSKARQQVEAIARMDAAEGIAAWADYYRSVHEREEAARQYPLLLNQKASSAMPYLEALEFFEGRRDTAKMELFLEQAARLAPADPRVAYYRSAVRILSGKELSEAEKDLKDYVANVPNRSDMPTHADAQEHLAQLYEKMGDAKRAEEQYRAVLALEPGRRSAVDGLNRVKRKA